MALFAFFHFFIFCNFYDFHDFSLFWFLKFPRASNPKSSQTGKHPLGKLFCYQNLLITREITIWEHFSFFHFLQFSRFWRNLTILIPSNSLGLVPPLHPLGNLFSNLLTTRENAIWEHFCSIPINRKIKKSAHHKRKHDLRAFLINSNQEENENILTL